MGNNGCKCEKGVESKNEMNLSNAITSSTIKESPSSESQPEPPKLDQIKLTSKSGSSSSSRTEEFIEPKTSTEVKSTFLKIKEQNSHESSGSSIEELSVERNESDSSSLNDGKNNALIKGSAVPIKRSKLSHSNSSH